MVPEAPVTKGHRRFCRWFVRRLATITKETCTTLVITITVGSEYSARRIRLWTYSIRSFPYCDGYQLSPYQHLYFCDGYKLLLLLLHTHRRIVDVHWRPIWCRLIIIILYKGFFKKMQWLLSTIVVYLWRFVNDN